MTYRLTTSALALSTALAAPAMADVSVADVWENQQTLFQSMGITLSGDLTGEALVAPSVDITLPMGLANLQVSTDASVAFSPNGDGSITITYPSPMNVTVNGGVQGEGSFTASMIVSHDGYSIVAAGDPNDVTYDSSVTNLRVEMADVTLVDPTSGAEDVAVTGELKMTEWSTQSRVTVGNLVTYAAETSYGSTSADYGFTIDDIVATNTQTTQPMQATVSATLPIGGSDIMNLSAATRDGLSFSAESTSEGSVSFSETKMGDSVFNSQATSIGSQTAFFSFGEDGLVATGSADTFQMSMTEPMIFPTELTFAVDQLTMNYDLPLNASDEKQDFRLATTLQGFSMGDEIWNMFDPASQFPRDPAEVSFDITGIGTNGVDLLDIMALSQMAGPPPIEVDEVTIDNLNIAAVGAQLMAQGAMTFDWSDFQTIPGIPRPEGAVTVNLNGANALLEALVAMGIMSEEDLMMPRMMMGMFATPVGDDMLESVLEINEQGHILANGQRLQ